MTEQAKRQVELTCVTTFDFNDALSIPKHRIKQWHDELLQLFRADSTLDYASFSSGNSMIFGRRNKETGEVRIIEVANGYESFNYVENTQP